MAKDSAVSLPRDEVRDAPEGYENLVQIDQGGFAVVYRALHTRLDRAVALKILRSDSLDDRQLRRFNAECLAIGRVSSHPNIVTVYDAGITARHRPWLAMEYCSGGSLARKLATQGPLPVAEVISIGARLCSALQRAHDAGILHRDVKPHNILLTTYGEPALADFGIASVVVGDEVVTETAAYTVVHCAPEILEGGTFTAAADIYSLGSTLSTLLVGRAPFSKEAGTGLAPLVAGILGNDLPLITRPGVPPELEQLLRRSMAARPQDRPASAADLGASLVLLGGKLAEDCAGRPRSADRPGPADRSGSASGNGSIASLHPRRVQGSGRHRAAMTPIPAQLAPESPSMSARRLLLMLGGVLTILLATFTTWGLNHGPAERGEHPTSPVTSDDRADARFNPQNVEVSQGHNRGELIVSWTLPIRPDVVATVIYAGAAAAQARAIVSYGGSPENVPQATVHGLPPGQRICLSAVHLVSSDDTITNTQAHPVCAVPR